MLQQLLGIGEGLFLYYSTLLYFWAGGSLANCLLCQQRRAAVHLFVIAQTYTLWNAPHYRAATFSKDLRNNLQNVAIPGTGIPLSCFCRSPWMLLLFILLVNPVITLIAAAYSVCFLRQHSSSSSGQQHAGTLAAEFQELLLQPTHWFASWRHNCLVMAWHELLTGSSSYRLEDKGTFLLEAAALGLPVSAYYTDAAAVFVKHKSVEGGMGIHVFRNFAHGGDWIIQPAMSNSTFLSGMLPPGAPLSTMRVVTGSIAWLEAWLEHQQQHEQQGPGSSGETQQMAQFLRKAEQRVADQEQRRAELHAHDAAAAAAAAAAADSNGAAAAEGNRNSSSHDRLLCMPAPGATVSHQPVRSPTLPRSTGVMAKRLNIEGRSGQFVDAVSSLASQGLITDPVLQPQHPDAGDSSPAEASHRDYHGERECASPDDEQQMYAGRVEVVTAVWRAGLAGSATDHSCVCFSIDTDTGQLQQGVTANHWYRLGLRGVGQIDAAAHTVFTSHPDSGRQVAGRILPDMAEVLDAVVQAHALAAPDLPLIGWDVALTQDGVSILEVNLSCNLFNGIFDVEGYYEFLFQYLSALEKLQRLDEEQQGRHHRRGTTTTSSSSSSSKKRI